MQRFEIVNIIICYNNGREVINYIDKLSNHNSIDKVCFVITVNAWTNEDILIINDYVDSSSVNIVLFQPKKNLGYMNGLIAGYKYFRKSHKRPLFVIMSNTDIEIPDNTFFSRLINMNYEKMIGCIGPSVYIKEKKSYDNPICEKRRSLKEVERIIKLFSNPLIGGIYYYLSLFKGYFSNKKKTNSRYVYEVHGCFFVLTGCFADIIQDLEYGAFLYSEEAFIAELILRNGMKSYYDNSLEIVHLEHATTKLVKCKTISKYIYESMLYIKKEFYTEDKSER